MKKTIIFLLSGVILLLGGCKNTKYDTAEKVNSDSVSNFSSIENKGFGWGFKKEKGIKPDIPKETSDMLAKYDAYFMDNEENKEMYLTFDEGYEAGYTASILDTLKKCKVPAAFFITGDYFDREQELVKRMINEGHIVGNHTEHHPNLPKLADSEKMKQEFKSLDNKFYNAFNEHMTYMRPPEGELSERVLAVAKAEGYKTILWSFAYRDWLRDNVHGKQYAIESVVPYFHNGAILLLHAVSKDNADALYDIIMTAKEEGYTFKSLDNLR